MQEQINRTIIALKTLIRKTKRKGIKSLINGVKWLYETTVKAIVVSILEWYSKDRVNK